jgi:hypothetical protein
MYLRRRKMNKMSLEEKIDMMKKYLLMKFHDEDWHGVADASMDIRELVAELKAKEISKEKEDAQK